LRIRRQSGRRMGRKEERETPSSSTSMRERSTAKSDKDENVLNKDSPEFDSLGPASVEKPMIG
jgi:hypothetical protein